jgi:SNF2 family DNA or RNA helicase
VQVASNPILVDQNYSAEPGKLPYLTSLIDQIHDNGEKCIVWTSFNKNAEWLARQLKAHGTCQIHGKMSMEQRNKSVERFLGDDATRILVATPGAAKEGLTLTVANHVIFYDRSFGLDDYLQAQDRIHRITQQKVCHVHNLIMQDSVDEWVDVLLHAKHMAAGLGQGDIKLEEYQSKSEYEFADILKEVLGITETEHGQEQF